MGLGNMGDALRKAGVLDEKRARELDRKSGGRKPRGDAPLASARPAVDPSVDAELRRKSRARLEAARLPRPRGQIRRFHWPEADGSLPFVHVAEREARGLEEGTLAIVAPTEVPWIVPAEVAREVAAEDPTVLRFHNEG